MMIEKMSSFLFALNAVMPIIITVAVGYFLKRIGLINEQLAKGAKKISLHCKGR